MSPHKDIKFPPLTSSQKQRLTYDQSQHNNTVQMTEESQEESSGAISVHACSSRNLCWTGSNYIYATPGRKPQLLMQLENFVNKELYIISPHEPNFQELKLQVYRGVFGCFINAFKTYQPILSAIKKEYENTLAHQQDRITELEPLRSHLRLVTEECDRKIQARWSEEQAEIGVLKREKQQLLKDIEAMREKEKSMQAVVDRLQSELSNQYLQYRDERDARKLLILQLNELTRGSAKTEHPADENKEDAKDTVGLQLALEVCRGDLTKAQEELTRMKAEYWDVVPRRDWDTLQLKHQQTLLQFKTLEGDFDQLKSEYDTLLELHKRGNMQDKTQVSISVQTDESVSQGQSQVEPNHLEELINSEGPESDTLTVQESRVAMGTAKSDQETDECVALAQSEADGSNDAISPQRPHSVTHSSNVEPKPEI
ncbi:translin-associated factor X-interacting protein 1 [Mugil cephalus]|uniref:translin-associated factor X-interacting protein 1 n=1 Tax=Mugil cephalus TaxID=48193 RepID=UPI001FB7FE66|nr:translin-associated factor X-interacting protein 1 [Mugil cephalus]